jgi:hypothetical protein
LYYPQGRDFFLREDENFSPKKKKKKKEEEEEEEREGVVWIEST